MNVLNKYFKKRQLFTLFSCFGCVGAFELLCGGRVLIAKVLVWVYHEVGLLWLICFDRIQLNYFQRLLFFFENAN
jgi:hypothetical protein